MQASSKRVCPTERQARRRSEHGDEREDRANAADGAGDDLVGGALQSQRCRQDDRRTGVPAGAEALEGLALLIAVEEGRAVAWLTEDGRTEAEMLATAALTLPMACETTDETSARALEAAAGAEVVAPPASAQSAGFDEEDALWHWPAASCAVAARSAAWQLVLCALVSAGEEPDTRDAGRERRDKALAWHISARSITRSLASAEAGEVRRSCSISSESRRSRRTRAARGGQVLGDAVLQAGGRSL